MAKAEQNVWIYHGGAEVPVEFAEVGDLEFIPTGTGRPDDGRISSSFRIREGKPVPMYLRSLPGRFVTSAGWGGRLERHDLVEARFLLGDEGLVAFDARVFPVYGTREVRFRSEGCGRKVEAEKAPA